MATKKIIVVVSVAVVALYFLPVSVPITKGLVGLGQPFGGRVIVKYRCPCSFNSQIFIGPPRGGAFTSDSGTIVYRERNLNIPAWTLGLADAYVPCLQYSGTACVPMGPGGPRIRMVGTSKF